MANLVVGPVVRQLAYCVLHLGGFRRHLTLQLGDLHAYDAARDNLPEVTDWVAQLRQVTRACVKALVAV